MDNQKERDAFELWCWRRLLRVPWTEKRTNQSILRQIKPETFLEAKIVKQKLSFFGHIMRSDAIEKQIMLGKVEGGKRKGRQRMRWMEGIYEATSRTLTNLRNDVMDRSSWRSFTHSVTKSRKWLDGT